MAIQISGTQVISNSRGLTNIASVDATTVAALGAAGVGGATSLITDWTTVSTNASSLQISLTGDYDAITIELRNITVASNHNDHEVRIRFKKANGTVISGNNLYATVGGNNDSAAGNDTSFINGTGGEFGGTSYAYPGAANTRLTVRNQRDYAKGVDYNVNGFVQANVGGTLSYGQVLNGYGACVNSDNPSAVFFYLIQGRSPYLNSAVFGSGAQYRVYGVKL